MMMTTMMMMMTNVFTGCRDARHRPVILVFCQKADVWSDERLVQQLARLLLYHCTTCCSPALRYAVNCMAHLHQQLRHSQWPVRCMLSAAALHALRALSILWPRRDLNYL